MYTNLPQIGSSKVPQSEPRSFDMIISDEKRSFDYLLSRLGKIKCSSCSCNQYYILSRKRIRCRRCRTDYNPLFGSRFSTINLPYSKWLALIKLFELSVSARSSSLQTGLSYKTVLSSFHIIRRAIFEEMTSNDNVFDDEIDTDAAYSGEGRKGSEKNKKTIIVFGILERKGKVTVDILKDLTAKYVLDARVQKRQRGNIVYTDRWRGYDSLMFSGYKPPRTSHQKRFVSKVYIDGIEGFLSFVKERMAKYHGVSPAKFLYYVKEMEWRYNNMGRDLFDMLVGYMLVANRT